MYCLSLKIMRSALVAICLLLLPLNFFNTGMLKTTVPGVWAKEYDYINISDPFLNKTPVAVTRFKPMTGAADEVTGGELAVNVMTSALDFTGYLKVMNAAAFLSDPSTSGIQLDQISFKDWTAIGAELLVTGGIEAVDGRIRLELRLFDTFNTRLLVGKIYTGTPKQIRKMIHMFCSEISMKLTGSYGVFGSKLAFVSTVGVNKEIFISDFDGHNPKQVTSHNSICLSPSWSFDGRWLAYVSYAKGRPDIFVKKLGERRGNVINYKGINISPDWMPGQLNLAATLSFSGNQEIYLLTRNGEIIKKVTDSWGIDVSPKFSPDGRKIAFTSNRGGNPQIYVKDLDAGEVIRVTFDGKYNTSPAWSPDGKKIAYVGIHKGAIDIFAVSFDTDPGIPVQLTKDQGSNEDPSWSPDGNLIVFKSDREGGQARLFVMTAAGTDQRRLLTLKGQQSQPDWSGAIGFEEDY